MENCLMPNSGALQNQSVDMLLMVEKKLVMGNKQNSCKVFLGNLSKDAYVKEPA